jgi:hypothetical protein
MLGHCFNIHHPGDIGAAMTNIYANPWTAFIGLYHPVFLL